MKGCSETAYNQINGCIQGFIGPLCNSCDYKGIYWVDSYAQRRRYCYECGKILEFYAYFALIILIYSMYILVSVNKQINTNLQIIKIEYLTKLQLLFVSKTKFIGSDTGIILRIFFHYLQIFSSCIDFFNQIPDQVGSLFKIGGDPTQVTYTSLDCIYKDWKISQLWLSRLIMQFVQIVIIIGVVLLARYFVQKNKRKFYQKQIYLIFFYFFYYSSIVKLLISLCLCKQIGSYSYMINNFLQKCWTSQHLLFQFGVTYPLTILFSIGIPLLFYFKIKSAKKMKSNRIFSLSCLTILFDKDIKINFTSGKLLRCFKDQLS